MRYKSEGHCYSSLDDIASSPLPPLSHPDTHPPLIHAPHLSSPTAWSYSRGPTHGRGPIASFVALITDHANMRAWMSFIPTKKSSSSYIYIQTYSYCRNIYMYTETSVSVHYWSHYFGNFFNVFMHKHNSHENNIFNLVNKVSSHHDRDYFLIHRYQFLINFNKVGRAEHCISSFTKVVDRIFSQIRLNRVTCV